MKISKAVAILDYIKKKKKVTSKELAEKFELSVRTVFRLVDDLSSFYPIYTERGRNGGFCWLEKEGEA